MDLEQLRALLTKAERFHQPEREPSIFALGGRVNQVFEHLLKDWRRYRALASVLVQMANELDNPDLDRSFMQALLFD